MLALWKFRLRLWLIWKPWLNWLPFRLWRGWKNRHQEAAVSGFAPLAQTSNVENVGVADVYEDRWPSC